MKQYYVIINDQQQGPFTMSQLSELGITPETEVWAEGMADWSEAGDVAELTELLQRQEFRQHLHSTPPPIPPRSRGESGTPQTAPASAAGDALAGSPADPDSAAGHAPDGGNAWSAPATPQPAPQRKGVKGLIALLCLLVVITLLAVTCPTRQAHQDAISDVSREWLGDKTQALTEQMGGLGSLVDIVVDWAGGLGINFALDEYLDVSNYVVVSVGRLTVGDDSRLVSLGVLGHVFTFNKQHIDMLLAHALDKALSTSGATTSKKPDRSRTAAPQAPIIEEDNDDSYLADPLSEQSDTTANNLGDELKDMAGDMLDSIAAAAKREAVNSAKKWIQKHL